MQFTSLKLINFQAHRKRVLEFSPGITTILGATDVGKSAIVRAFRWVCLNGMQGTGFIRQGKKQALAKLTVVHQKQLRTVRRIRGKENRYHLDDKKYVAFGLSVPEDIRALLQLSEINFQNQFDSPFWFGKNAGEVSRELNAIIDLSVIDHSLEYVSALVRRCQERKSVSEERRKQAEDEYENLQTQKERVVEFDRLSQQAEAAGQAQADFRQLDSLLSDYYTHRNHLRRLREESRQLEEILVLAERVRQIAQQRDRIESLLEGASKHSLLKPPPPLGSMDQTFATVQSRKRTAERLHYLIQRIEDGSQELRRAKDDLSVAEMMLHLRTKDELCPLCGGPLRPEKIIVCPRVQRCGH